LSRTGNTINNYLYAGEQLDPNIGFYYLRARYYNQQTGRFVTTDPFHGSIYDPVSLHKYLYANVNPVMNSDPSGMLTLFEVSFVVGLIVVLTATFHSIVILGSHLGSQRLIDWNGYVNTTAVDVVLAAGFLIGVVESQCVLTKDNEYKRGTGVFEYQMYGLSASFPDLSSTIGSISLVTPGFLGPDPILLSGLVTWWSATLAAGTGLSYTAFLMGLGSGKFGWLPSTVVGYDFGIDIMSGLGLALGYDQSTCFP
jgi:RHS repeat-associated protein